MILSPSAICQIPQAIVDVSSNQVTICGKTSLIGETAIFFFPVYQACVKRFPYLLSQLVLGGCTDHNLVAEFAEQDISAVFCNIWGIFWEEGSMFLILLNRPCCGGQYLAF